MWKLITVPDFRDLLVTEDSLVLMACQDLRYNLFCSYSICLFVNNDKKTCERNFRLTILILCNDGYDVNVCLHSWVSVGKWILISLSKGCSRRSWNFWPTGAKRYPRRPRTHRRTWSTRCKGNTEELGIPVLMYCIITIFCLFPHFHCLWLFLISQWKGLTGTPGVQGAEGKPGPLVGHV